MGFFGLLGFEFQVLGLRVQDLGPPLLFHAGESPPRSRCPILGFTSRGDRKYLPHGYVDPLGPKPKNAKPHLPEPARPREQRRASGEADLELHVGAAFEFRV